MKFKINEVNLNRIYNAAFRRIKSIPNKIKWSFSSKSLINKKKLNRFSNLHKGKRCFLVANGPSLKKMDLSFLQNEISFGLNRIYLAYDEMAFENDYLVSINSLVLSQFNNEIQELKMPKFLNWESRNLFKEDESIFFIYKKIFGNKFGKNASQSLNPAATVTYAALQIIFYMGFSEVIIIGMDHNFVTKSKNQPNKKEIRDEEVDLNHFHSNYFPKGSEWETPDLVSSEYFYSIAKKIFEKDNRKIFDCTIDGKCDVFEKRDLKDFI